jgi:hypothetical protein
VREFHYQFIESLNEALNHHYLTLEKKKSIMKESPVRKDQDEEMKEVNEAEDVDMAVDEESKVENKGPLHSLFFGKLK